MEQTVKKTVDTTLEVTLNRFELEVLLSRALLPVPQSGSGSVESEFKFTDGEVSFVTIRYTSRHTEDVPAPGQVKA